jgi:hypothetical protein
MTIPLENLDDKTYADLVKESLARIPVYAPQWTDWNESDPGITLIELLAWLTEMQIYSLNRIDDRSRLKFLKLLGVPRPYPPMPAEVDLTFKLKGDSPKTIPEGTAVASLNLKTGEQISFETISEVSLSPSAPAATVQAVQWTWKCKEFQSDGLPNQALRADESIFIRGNETIENAPIVEVNEATWEYREDLDGSHATDTHFTASPEAGTITFGDGAHGKIPEKGKINVKYRSSTGSRGNVKAEAIDQILDPGLAESVTVKNTEAARGGTDVEETLESAIGRARKDLREITRAVNAADYEHLALACPDADLARVKALEMHHPFYDFQVPTAVSVVIVPMRQVFCWDDIPGQDNKKLLEFLAWKLDIDWTGTPEIIKIDMTIKVYNEEKFISFKFDDKKRDDKKEEVTLEFNVNRNEKLIARTENDKLNVYDKIGKSDQAGISLFCWDDIPGHDNEKLLEFLAWNRGIGLTGTPEVEKIDNNMTIIVHNGEKSISLKLDNNNKEVALNFDVNRNEKLIAEIENDKLNVYDETGKPDKAGISLVKDYLENYRLLGTNLFVIAPEYVPVKVKTDVAKDPRYMDNSVIDNVKAALEKFLNSRVGGGPDGRGWPFGRPVYLSEVMQVVDGAKGVDHVKRCGLYSWVKNSWIGPQEKIEIKSFALVCCHQVDHDVIVSLGDEQVD